MVATCGRVTIAEVEHLVGPGELEPDHIHTPSVFVQRLIVAVQNEKRIEQRVIRKEVA
jgi:3-oxoacid CoA-transferase subunit A